MLFDFTRPVTWRWQHFVKDPDIPVLMAIAAGVVVFVIALALVAPFTRPKK